MNPETQILHRAYQRWLESPCKIGPARDKKGAVVPIFSRMAVAWSPLGAIWFQQEEFDYDEVRRASLLFPNLVVHPCKPSAVAWAFVAAIQASSMRRSA